MIPQNRHIKALDGLRGIAALSVVVGHCMGQAQQFAPLTGRSLTVLHEYFMFHSWPVPAFIVLSGFVLSIPSISTLELRGGVVDYLKRRARRILPAYYFALCFSIIVAAFFVGTFTGRDWVSTVLSPALLFHDFYGSTDSYDVPLWSLPVEFHCYLMLPILLIVWRKFGLKITLVTFFSAIFIVGSLLPQSHLEYWACFIFGVVVAWLYKSPSNRAVALRSAVPWRSLTFVYMALFLGLYAEYGFANTANDHTLINVGWAVLVALLIYNIAVNEFVKLRLFLELPIVQWLGQRSYSIYLLHWPILLLAQTLLPASYFVKFTVELWAVVLPFTLILASVSWYLFERNSQNVADHPRRRWGDAVAARSANV